MGKKIFAVLLLLLTVFTSTWGQNEKKDKISGRVKKDMEFLQYNAVRNVTDSMKRAQTLQELISRDTGTVSVATVISMFKPFILPPLDELFERAKNNPSVKQRQHEVDEAWRDVVSQRRTWMDWFHGSAAYTYGKYSSNLFYQQSNIPTSETYSNTNSSYYLVGGSFQVSLYDVVNMGNKIQQQKDKYYEYLNRYKAEWETQMERIAKSYYAIQYATPLIIRGIERAKLAELSYEDAKLNFIAGRGSTSSLFDAEDFYFRAIQELASTIRDVNMDVKFIELVTDSKIIPDNINDNTYLTPDSSKNSSANSVASEYPANTVNPNKKLPQNLSRSQKKDAKRISKKAKNN